MSGLKVLLTGGTGYIGGSVLSTLLASESPALKDISLSALVRGENQAKVLAEKGLHVELFQDLDQTDLLENTASNYDAVIQCVTGYHTASAVALVRGLGKRSKKTGKQTYYIHTSGTSNLGDLPLSGKHHESHVFSDRENIYSYEKYRESIHPYAQRATEIAVVETGLASGVNTIIIMSPTIYGMGSGFFNRLSIQIPTIFRAALKRAQAVRVGDHHAVWNYVHIEDLVVLYEMVLARIAEGKQVPYGERGIIFSEAGEFAWSEVHDGVAKALKKRGELSTEKLYTLSLPEAADEFAGGDQFLAEVGFASNSRTRADVSREWGWKPQKTHEDFLNTFDIEADAVLQGKRDVQYASHLSNK